MMYIRGNKADYDSWVAEGNHGWDWKSVLPYFKKSAAMQKPSMSSQMYFNEYHETNSSGIKVTRAQNFDYHFDRYLKAFSEVGFKLLPEHNGPEQLGFSYTDYTISDGIRESTARRYLLPYKNGTNLYIVKDAFVNKVLIDYKTKIARGVEVKLEDKVIRVYSRKEVIVSAGAIGSPEILLKSGIGPKEDLQKNRICTVTQLPVGENFHDHVFVPLVITGKENPIKDADRYFSFIQYLYNRSGLLSSGPVPLINGFFTIHDGQTFPDIQVGSFYFESNHSGVYAMCSGIFQYKDEVCDSLRDLNSKTEILFMAVVLLHPKSRGYIKLGDNGELIVDPNYLGNDNDLITLKEGVKLLTKLIKAESLQNTNPSLGQLNIAQCNSLQFASDEYWSCYVRNMASSLLHPVGSCAMGKVVDAKLKVYNIFNLRVVDASIMPSTVSGNTNAPTVMIGEKAADIIKGDHL